MTLELNPVPFSQREMCSGWVYAKSRKAEGSPDQGPGLCTSVYPQAA